MLSLVGRVFKKLEKHISYILVLHLSFSFILEPEWVSFQIKLARNSDSKTPMRNYDWTYCYFAFFNGGNKNPQAPGRDPSHKMQYSSSIVIRCKKSSWVCSYILKAGFAGSQKPQKNQNFPQKDCLKTRKLLILRCVIEIKVKRKDCCHSTLRYTHTQPLFQL